MEMSTRGKSGLRKWPIFLAIILFSAPVWAQKHEHESSAPAPQHSAPPPPRNNNSGGGGGSNANTPRGNTGTSGASTSHNPYGGTGSSGSSSHNPYGSYGNANNGGEHGGTGTSGSSSHNPYGNYANAPKSGGSAGGAGVGNSSRTNTNERNGAGLNERAGGEARGSNGVTEHGGGNTRGLNERAGGEARGSNGVTERGGGNTRGLNEHAGGNARGLNERGGGAGGGKVVTRADGSRAEFNRGGKPTSVTAKNGAVTRFNSNGRVASIHRGGLTVNRGGRGGRTIVNERADHSRVVSVGAHRGFVEHPFSRGGRPYMRRTYMDHGRYYARAYRGYYWHGHAWYGYTPGYYYGRGFYGWAYSPWASPVVYSWGWGGAPWAGYYGYYFTPYPVYATASLWLTDYMISQNLQAGYEAQQEQDASAGAQSQAQSAPPQQSGGAVVLTPEVKQAIADEVKAQLAAEQTASANPTAVPPNVGGEQTPAALDPTFRTFIVASTLSETGPDGTQCSLSQGDVLTRIDDTPDQNQNVGVLVTGTQRNDCTSGAKLSVGVQDLQDMHNAFNEQIDSGLKTLADNSGKNGLPMAPATNTTQVPDAQVQPDQDAGSDLQQTQQDANQAENQAGQAQ